VDQVELSASPEALAAGGHINAVEAVMLGSNLNEGRYLMPLQMPLDGAPTTSLPQLLHWLHEYYPSYNHSAILQHYLPLYPRYWEAAAAIFTDSQYYCPTRRSAEWLVASQKVDGNKVFVYQLGYAPSFLGVVSEILYWYEWCPRWPLPCKQMAQHMGVGHTADVPLVWGGPKAILNATDQQVSRQMIDLWHGLAHTGWPSSLWHSYAVANETAQLAIRFSLVHNGKAEECAVWAHARSLKP